MRLRDLAMFAAAIAIIALLYFSPFRNPLVTGNIINSNATMLTPYDRVNESSIQISDNKVIININNARIGRFANTSSMMPTISENATSIEIVPSQPEQIHSGDIITFEQGGLLVVHRVIGTGYDSKGWYATTKGDNSQGNDGKTRFEQIKYITIGILY